MENWDIDREAETIAKQERRDSTTHGDLMGVLESIQREINDFRLTRERELADWMRWRNGVDTKVNNLSEAWGEHGKKAAETSEQLAEIIRITRSMQSMLIRRAYRDAADGKEAEQELRGLG